MFRHDTVAKFDGLVARRLASLTIKLPKEPPKLQRLLVDQFKFGHPFLLPDILEKPVGLLSETSDLRIMMIASPGRITSTIEVEDLLG